MTCTPSKINLLKFIRLFSHCKKHNLCAFALLFIQNTTKFLKLITNATNIYETILPILKSNVKQFKEIRAFKENIDSIKVPHCKIRRQLDKKASLEHFVCKLFLKSCLMKI